MARPRGTALSSEIILDQLEVAFHDLRLQDLSIAMISKVLNIKPPSLYSHFKNLEDIKDQLTERALIKMHMHLSESVRKNIKKDGLISFMYGYREFAFLFPLLFDSAQYGIKAENVHLMSKAHTIVEIVLNLLKDKAVDNSKLIHQVRILRSLLNGFIMLEKEQGFQRNESLKKTFLELINFAKKGIG